MNIELKGIKHYASMSEETYCYEAILYRDGKKVGRVSNRGHGGADDTGFSVDVYREIDAWCRANLPVNISSIDGAEDDTTLEEWCHDQVTDFLYRRDLKKALKKTVVRTSDGETYLMNVQWTEADAERIRAAIEKQMPGGTILNALPFEDALNLWRQQI